MNDGHAMDVLYFALLLILPISALAARRLPLSRVAMYALIWLAIIATVVLAIYLLGLGKPRSETRPVSREVALSMTREVPHAQSDRALLYILHNVYYRS